MSMREVSLSDLKPSQILSGEGRPHAPVSLFGSPRLPLSQVELAALERIARLPGVVAVAALPDLHVKPNLETPSSLATATAEVVYLSLSSPSPGCGMALALTPLAEADLDPGRLDDLFVSLSRQMPYRRDERTVPRSAILRRLPEVFMSGARAGIQYFGLDEALLAGIDSAGNAFGSVEAGADEVLASLPPAFFPLAASEFGRIGRGNHFFELQVVDEILDPAAAEAWNVHPGQVVAMYHSDSGRFGSLVGRLYAHRRKNTWRGRLQELRYKTAFHYGQAHSLGEFWDRMKAYYLPARHRPLAAGAPETRRALLALYAAANYAYANRIAILANFADALRAVWRSPAVRPDLLADLSHNSIRLEEVQGRKLWVHRHNASPALPPGHAGLAGGPFAATGQPLLLPGTSQTSSYLCAARPGTAGSLHSVDHGAGRAAVRLGSPLPTGRHTRLYDYHRGFAGLQPHRDSAGVDEVLGVLQRANLAAPVARLRPVAVLKDAGR